ncbi:hypothetical protein [Aquamicrobium defluvii]|uniref:hypothetical protein n=1 Tax=Aquamicrobium defluvii TaxID=69279 RepID=UPI0012EBFCFF|nr:hypothetical protein [Aquamicrobium defluvii]
MSAENKAAPDPTVHVAGCDLVKGSNPDLMSLSGSFNRSVEYFPENNIVFVEERQRFVPILQYRPEFDCHRQHGQLLWRDTMLQDEFGCVLGMN